MMTIEQPPAASHRSIVILTGAGISAESGISTFRDRSGQGAGALWTRFDPFELATPEAFARDPHSVPAFYNARRRALLDAAPNAAHHVVVRLAAGLAARGDHLVLMTQNVDDLHERAGSPRALHMHGELLKVRCRLCEAVSVWRQDLRTDDTCPSCNQAGCLRPHVVYFGEVPLHLPEIEDALAAADLFVAIGTSGSVYPAAGFVSIARANGVRTCELSFKPSDNGHLFDERRYSSATTIVPAWVDNILARSPRD